MEPNQEPLIATDDDENKAIPPFIYVFTGMLLIFAPYGISILTARRLIKE